MVRPVVRGADGGFACPRLPSPRLDIVIAMYAVQFFTVIAATGCLPVRLGRGTGISLILVSWIIQLVVQGSRSSRGKTN